MLCMRRRGARHCTGEILQSHSQGGRRKPSMKPGARRPAGNLCIILRGKEGFLRMPQTESFFFIFRLLIKAHLRRRGCVCLLAYNCTRRCASLAASRIWTFLNSLGAAGCKIAFWRFIMGVCWKIRLQELVRRVKKLWKTVATTVWKQ